MKPLILFPAVGVVIAMTIRVVTAKRNRYQYLDGPIAQGSTDLKLSGGPRYGQAVVVDIPIAVGEAVPAAALRLRATHTARGQYVVIDVDELLHRATAKWVLAR